MGNIEKKFINRVDLNIRREIIQYLNNLTSQSDPIILDFKVKGEIDNPRFYLGSKTKRMLGSMVIDKVTSNTDVEKAIDLLKDILD